MPATTPALNELRDNLALGLNIVTRIWDFKTKDWVTSVFAADVNNDGEAEVVACTRDGRVFLLTAEKGEDRWERVVGDKSSWVGAGDVIEGVQPRVIVGKVNGKVYYLDKDGNTISRDGKVFASGKDGRARDAEAEEVAQWFQAGNVVRQVHFNAHTSLLVVGSDDRRVYGLDSRSGELRWQFEADGWVHTVSVCDINQDGEMEVLVGSVDKFLYVLNRDGQPVAKHDMKFPVRNIVANDVDNDGSIEMLISTDGKDLAALTYDSPGIFTEKWRIALNNRILDVCVVDIDDDGKKEIIASSEDKYTYFFDENGAFIWRHNHYYRVNSLFPYDIDKDGLPELLMGSDDNVVRAMRIRLRRGMDKKIRASYQRLGKVGLGDIEGLPFNERMLLEDILHRKKAAHATLQQAETFKQAGDYAQALLTLLNVQRQQVQLHWFRDDVGHIRTLSFRQTRDDPMREIITGTTEGLVQAFKANKKLLWSRQFKDRIIDVQTGYIDRNRQEDVVVCSSDRHVYILSGAARREPRKAFIGTRVSSVCITPSQKQQSPQIITGSEERELYLLNAELEMTTEPVQTERGIGIVRVYASDEARRLEIVVGSLDNYVYAYTRSGARIWEYEAYHHIRSICVKDIDADGNIEIIIGSEDRNIHVLNSSGKLLWRYYLPHSVLAIDAADANLDGNMEIFVGCGDGFLYAFNHEGDFLWKYEAHDRVQSVRVEDINNDGFVEIALGAEDRLELLQVINHAAIRDQIKECWRELCRNQSARELLNNLLRSPNPVLRAFVLQKLSEQPSFSTGDFELLERFTKDNDIEVRQALVRIAFKRYQSSPMTASRILQALRVDPEQEVRSTLVENLPLMTMYDWEQSFNYLQHFAETDNRYVRRLAVRIIHRLIDLHREITPENQRKLFELLLNAALDEKEWVRQEAARTLAHFLDRYYRRLVIDVQMFIVKEVQKDVLEHIASAAKMPIVKRYLEIIIAMVAALADEHTLNIDEVLESARQSLRILEEATELKYSQDLLLIYNELHHLLTISTINELAQYQCQLSYTQFAPENQFARIMMDIFKELSSITRALRIYLRREGLPDQLSSLLAAQAEIEKVQKFLEEAYSRELKGEPITNLPDHKIFLLLLRKWRQDVDLKVRELRGKADIRAELLIKQTLYNDQVGLWLAVTNAGRSSASNVKVTLLHDDDFPVVGKNMSAYETIAPGDKEQVEFIIKPRASTLNLRFEVVYDDAERTEKAHMFVDRLELSKAQREFRDIPNLYSSGLPTQDRKMFFGREADLAYLVDNLAREAKTLVVLYGQRRSGKTTLLLQLTNETALGVYIPILIDMQEISAEINFQKFVYKLAYAIARAMKKNQLPVCEPKLDNFATNPTHDFMLFLDGIEESLGEHKLILLIDEFEVLEDQVAQGRLQPEIFEYLRNILQHRRNINFLFSGTHEIIEHTRSYHSIFFNIARHYHLTRLSKDGAIALIQQPVAGYLEYEPLAIEKIRQLTNDQPYLIHLLCRAIIDYCNDNSKTYVAINDINNVLREVMETIHFYFGWLWERVSGKERVILSVLAEGGKEDGHWLTLDEVIELCQRTRISIKREHLLDCLRKLVDHDIIESESSDPRDIMLDSRRFRIPVGLIRRWLLRERPLELVRNQMVG